jgi:hypothetical protein
MNQFIKILLIDLFIIFTIGLLMNPYSLDLALWALLSLFVSLIPIIRFFFGRDLRHIVIFVPVSMTWIYFLLPYLNKNLVGHSYRIIPMDHIYDMAMYSSLSVISLVLGFYAISERINTKTISPSDTILNINTIKRLAYILLLLGILSRIIEYYAYWLTNSLGQLLQLLDFAPVLTFCIGFLYFLRGGRGKFFLSVISIYFVFEILLRVSETLFSKIAFLMIALFFIYIINVRKMPWKTILLVFLIAFPIFNNRMEFRMEAHNRWYGLEGVEKIGIMDLAVKGIGMTVESYDLTEWGSFSESPSTQSSSRFENISYLGQVVHMVKNQGKDLKYGETLWWAIITPIPRVIFPWKPVNNHATLLAEEYGTKGVGSKAAMNFPMLVEFFANFGFIGMIFFSFLQGVLYKWTLEKIAFGQGDINMLAFVNILWHLVRVEANTTLIFGGIFQALIAWWVIIRIINYFKKNKFDLR